MSECEQCCNTEDLQKHHLTYETITLCRTCHIELHKNPSAPKRPGRVIFVSFDDAEHEKMKKAKGKRTWKQVLKDGLESAGNE